MSAMSDLAERVAALEARVAADRCACSACIMRDRERARMERHTHNVEIAARPVEDVVAALQTMNASARRSFWEDVGIERLVEVARGLDDLTFTAWLPEVPGALHDLLRIERVAIPHCQRISARPNTLWSRASVRVPADKWEHAKPRLAGAVQLLAEEFYDKTAMLGTLRIGEGPRSLVLRESVLDALMDIDMQLADGIRRGELTVEDLTPEQDRAHLEALWRITPIHHREALPRKETPNG